MMRVASYGAKVDLKRRTQGSSLYGCVVSCLCCMHARYFLFLGFDVRSSPTTAELSPRQRRCAQQQQQLAAFRLAPHVVATDSDGPGSRAPMLWPRQSYAGCRWRRSTRQATVRGRMSYEYQNDPSARRAIERGFEPDGCSGVMCTVGCMAGYLSWIWLMAVARRGGGVCLFS